MLWATHDINEALAIADDLLLLRRGRAVAFGPLETSLNSEALEETFGIRASVQSEPSGPRRVTFFR